MGEDPGGDSDDVECFYEIVEVFPEHGSSDVYYRSVVEVTFRVPGPEAVEPIRVTRSDGARIDGVELWSEDRTRLTFTPSAPLEPNTGYRVEQAYGCGTPLDVAWTTSSAGDPVDLARIDGAVYALVPTDGRWIAPEAGILQGLFLLQLDEAVALVSAVATEAGGATVRLAAVADAGAPVADVCSPTVDLTFAAALTESPYVELTAAALELPTGEGVARLETVRLTGAFTPDGAGIEGATIDARLDLRSLFASEDLGGDYCLFAEVMALECVSCADGEPACVGIQADRLRLARVGTDGLPEVTAEDVLGDPTCSAL